MGKLDGKVAVVTGGSSGIGFATAKLFADEGAHVFIVGRRPGPLADAATRIGSNATPVQADISDLDDLDRLWAVVRAEHAMVDIIIANASYVELATFAEATTEHFDQTFDTNVRGTFFTVHKGLPLLRDGASIVLLSSSAHQRGVPVLHTYVATKATICSLAKSWAAELVGRRIRVNSLSPGPVDTPMVDAAAEYSGDIDLTREAQAKRQYHLACVC